MNNMAPDEFNLLLQEFNKDIIAGIKENDTSKIRTVLSRIIKFTDGKSPFDDDAWFDEYFKGIGLLLVSIIFQIDGHQ